MQNQRSEEAAQKDYLEGRPQESSKAEGAVHLHNLEQKHQQDENIDDDELAQFQDSPSEPLATIEGVIDKVVELFKIIATEEIEIERLRIALQKLGQLQDEDYRLIFESVDTNGAGFVRAEEMKAFYDQNNTGPENISLEQCQQVITEYDANEDGMLAFEEFVSLIRPSTIRNAHPSRNHSITIRNQSHRVREDCAVSRFDYVFN